jgi:hypothetical protein
MNFLVEKATIEAPIFIKISTSPEPIMFIFGTLIKKVVTMWQCWGERRSGDSGIYARHSAILL